MASAGEHRYRTSRLNREPHGKRYQSPSPSPKCGLQQKSCRFFFLNLIYTLCHCLKVLARCLTAESHPASRFSPSGPTLFPERHGRHDISELESHSRAFITSGPPSPTSKPPRSCSTSELWPPVTLPHGAMCISCVHAGLTVTQTYCHLDEA